MRKLSVWVMTDIISVVTMTCVSPEDSKNEVPKMVWEPNIKFLWMESWTIWIQFSSEERSVLTPFLKILCAREPPVLMNNRMLLPRRILSILMSGVLLGSQTTQVVGLSERQLMILSMRTSRTP